MENRITPAEIAGMVRHWLEVPINGYLGDGYGSNLPDLLQTPQASGIADSVIAKMVRDIPILGGLPPGTINIYSEERGIDGINLLIEVAGEVITINTPSGPR